MAAPNTTVYLDNAATSPMSAAALAAYVAAAEQVGNASSLHAYGRRARGLVEDAREAVAAALDAHPTEVIFTHGGTEANNLAIKGTYWAHAGRLLRPRSYGASKPPGQPDRLDMAHPPDLLLSAIEHHSVLEPAQWLRDCQGANLNLIPVNAYGVISLSYLAEHISDDLALISVMLANNEIGTIEPIQQVVEIAHQHKVPVHTDAIAALGQVPVRFNELGVDLLSIAGHKVGGPVSSGALLAKRSVKLQGLVQGGGQERNLRAGTLDVPAIAAFGVAVTEAVANQPAHGHQLAKLRDDLIIPVLASIPDATLQGPPILESASTSGALRQTSGANFVPEPPLAVAAAAPIPRLPGNALFTFANTTADTLLFLLDQASIAASAGAACSAGVAEPSHVLLACGVPPELARGAIRFTLGPATTQADIDYVCEVLPGIVAQAQQV